MSEDVSKMTDAELMAVIHSKPVEALSDAELMSVVGHKQQQASPAMQTLSGAAEGTGIPAIYRLSTPQGRYDTSAEGVAKAAGDIGTTAGMGALTATVGPRAALATGAALGAAGGALDASPIGQGLHRAAETAIQTNGGLPAANLPSKLGGIEGAGTAVNFLTRLPAATLAAVDDALPQGLALFAGGKVMAGGGAPEAVVPPEVRAAKLLEDYGGKATPSMSSPGKSGWRVKADSLASNLAPGTMEDINNANLGAIRKYVGEKLPAASEDMQTIGNRIADSMDSFKAERGAEFNHAENLVSQVKLPEGVKSGNFAQQAIAKLLKSKQLKPGQESLSGNEPVDPNAVGPLNRLYQKLGNAKSIEDLINQRRQWEDTEGPQFSEGMKGRGEAILQTGRKLVNDTIGRLLEFNDKLNAQGGVAKPGEKGMISSPEGNMTQAGPREQSISVKDIWDEANAKYSSTQKLMQDVYSTIGEKHPSTGVRQTQVSPENFYNSIVTKMAGSNRVAALKEILGDRFKPFEDAAVNQMLQKGYNGLETGLSKNNGLQSQVLSPETLGHLENVKAMAERGNLVNKGMGNASGTANAMYSKVPAWEMMDSIKRGLMGAGTMALTGHPSAEIPAAAAGAVSPFIQTAIARGWLNHGSGLEVPQFPTAKPPAMLQDFYKGTRKTGLGFNPGPSLWELISKQARQ